jgi:DNA-binding LacI/PurR family transcriptional regulator
VTVEGRATSIDVARRCGVSQSTVSLVLSGKGAGRVSAATAAAVRAAADELGYRPNAAARALKTGASHTLGLVVPDVTNAFFGRMLRGAQRAARGAGYAVALVDTGNDHGWGDDAADLLRAGGADGMLLFGRPPAAGSAPAGGAPLVLIEAEAAAHPSVRLDVEAGVEAAARHLLGLGHERIAHVASEKDEATFGLRAARLDALLGAHPRAFAPHDAVGAARAVAALLAGERGVTALICDDDNIAAGAYLAARAAGRAIPATLSVVGFDDLDVALVLDPPLTTVAADAEALGRAAVELLLERLGRAPGAAAPVALVQPVALVERGSTAPPAG